MQRYNLEDNSEIHEPKTLSITLKDHELNFDTKLTVILICPTKLALCKINKHIPKLRSVMKVILWFSPKEVINWFTEIQNGKS